MIEAIQGEYCVANAINPDGTLGFAFDETTEWNRAVKSVQNNVVGFFKDAGFEFSEEEIAEGEAA